MASVLVPNLRPSTRSFSDPSALVTPRALVAIFFRLSACHRSFCDSAMPAIVRSHARTQAPGAPSFPNGLSQPSSCASTSRFNCDMTSRAGPGRDGRWSLYAAAALVPIPACSEISSGLACAALANAARPVSTMSSSWSSSRTPGARFQEHLLGLHGGSARRMRCWVPAEGLGRDPERALEATCVGQPAPATRLFEVVADRGSRPIAHHGSRARCRYSFHRMRA